MHTGTLQGTRVHMDYAEGSRDDQASPEQRNYDGGIKVLQSMLLFDVEKRETYTH